MPKTEVNQLTMLKTIFFIISLSFLNISYSQNNSVEVSFGFGKANSEKISSYSTQLNIHIYELHLTNGELKINFGPRLTNYSAILLPTNDSYTELVKDLNLYAINLFTQINYIYSQFFIGFDLDLIGYSISRRYKTKDLEDEVNAQKMDLFLFEKNDKGTLNSHVYIGTNIGRYLFKIGLSHSVINFEGTQNESKQKRQLFFDLAFLSIGTNF